MTDHVVHECPQMNGVKWGKPIGWPIKAIPLNKRAHPDGKCPYCEAPFDDKIYRSATAAEIAILASGRAGTRNTRGQGASHDLALSELQRDVADLKELLKTALKGGKIK